MAISKLMQENKEEELARIRKMSFAEKLDRLDDLCASLSSMKGYLLADIENKKKFKAGR